MERSMMCIFELSVICGVGSCTCAVPSEVKTSNIQFLYLQTLFVN